jgi:hypothetical protein
MPVHKAADAREAVRDYIALHAHHLTGNVYEFLVYARAVRCGTRLDRELQSKHDDAAILLDGAKLAELRVLIREAHASPLAFDACVLIAECMLTRGERLPVPLVGFALDAMRAKKRRPSQRDETRYKNLGRDYVIRMAVFVAKKHGLKPTRNESTRGRVTGCQVVAECLTELGIPIKSATVAKVWEHRQYE